jgi:hypothetical protein
MGRIKKHRIKSITRTGSLNYSYAVIYNPNPGIKSEISITNQYHQFGIGYGYAFKNWVFFLNLSAIQTRYGSYGISLSSKSIDSTNFAEFKVTDLSRKWRWNLVPSLEISYAPFAKKLPNLSVGAEWMFHGFENDPLSFKTNINRAAYEVLVQPKFWFCSVRIAYTFSGSIGKNWRPFKEKE